MSKEKELSLDSMSRGWSCLERFAERIRGFESHQVRVVATQTLREAANRDVFITTAKKYWVIRWRLSQGMRRPD